MGFILEPIVKLVGKTVGAVGGAVGSLFGGGGGSSSSPKAVAASPAVRAKVAKRTTQSIAPRSQRQTDISKVLLKSVRGGGSGGFPIAPLGSGGGSGFVNPDDMGRRGYKSLLGQ